MASPLPIIVTLLSLLVTPSLASLTVNTSAISDKLTVGFYKTTCPQVENITLDVLKSFAVKDTGALPGVLRLHFHDCFITGCDGSILVTPEKYNYFDSEMAHPSNGISLRGLDIIEAMKTEVEKQCPNTVSCADILAYAARDAVRLVRGGIYPVPAGRRDGSNIDGDYAGDLPLGTATIEALSEAYAAKGLTVEDLVVLEGSHTMGQSRCQGTISDAGSLEKVPESTKIVDKKFAAWVTQEYCPTKLHHLYWNITVPLNAPKFPDFGPWGTAFYKNVIEGTSVIPSDLAMAVNVNTKDMVKQYANDQILWMKKFNEAMIKLGKINVLTGEQGEIRRQCGILNQVNMPPASN